MSIEAMKLALEALDCIYSPLHVREIEKVGGAMFALRAAIEQAEKQKPYRIEQDLYGEEVRLYTTPPAAQPAQEEIQRLTALVRAQQITIEKLEAAQPAPVQEPVAWMYEVNGAHTCLDLFEPPDDAYDEGTLHPLYTTPQEFVCSTGLCHYKAQRQWAGLTDESVVSAAARVLSDRVAASCNVDCGEMWMLHCNDSIEDARAMLEAADAKLREKNT